MHPDFDAPSESTARPAVVAPAGGSTPDHGNWIGPAVAVLFGLVAPVACLAFDPGIFHHGDPMFSPDGPLAEWRAVAYSSIGAAMFVLAAWLPTRRWRLTLWRGFASGALVVSALLAAAIGVAILPLTLLGLLVLIGIFGLTPFVTACVYGRLGWLAWRDTPGGFPRTFGAIFGAAFIVGAGFGGLSVEAAAERDISAVIADPAGADDAIERLQWTGWAGDTDRIVLAWGGTDGDRWRAGWGGVPDGPRTDALAEAYRRITGRDVSDRFYTITFVD